MSQPPARRSLVLIVDDAGESSLVAAALRADYEVQLAASGDQAVELATARPGPDLILLDLVMPGMDGFTACRLLKEDERTRFVPIIIMTALDAGEDRLKGIEAGADDFLTKPVDQRQLVARIRNLLRTKHGLDDKLRAVEDGAAAVKSRPSGTPSAPSSDDGAEPAALHIDGDPALEPGQMVGEYRIERKLGSGAFGDVYAAEQPLIGKRVAVKVLNRRFASDPEMVSRFMLEARAVNRIRQRNIIDIFSFGVMADSKRAYFVMELLEGKTLREMMGAPGSLPMPAVIAILQGIAAGLDAAHAAGVTHRDLKPDNVIVMNDESGGYFPKVLDFGIAKLTGDDLAHQTRSGIVLGTPRYMSPEQARGRPADHLSDVYALGVIIHELLTGSAPFDGPALDVLLQHANDPPPPMSSVRPDLPAGLDGPVLAMLAKRPKDRPSSVGRAIAALVERAVELGLVEPGVVERAAVSAPVSPTAPPASGPRQSARQISARTTAVDQVGRRAPDLEVPDPTQPDVPSVEAMAIEPAASGPIESGPLTSAARSAPRRDDISGIGNVSVSPVSPRRPWRLTAISALAMVGAATIWALRTSAPHLPAPAPRPPSEVTARGTSLAPAVSPASERKESLPITVTAAPVVASADAPPQVALRFTARPADAEVWLGDRKLGAADEPIRLPRAAAPVELRLQKAGFQDERVTVAPDHDQAVSATLVPLAASPRKEPLPAGKPVPSAGRLDRLLGERE